MISYQDDLIFQDDTPLSLCERRDQTRKAPTTDKTCLWVKGHAVPAEVIDVSDAGIGMVIPDRPFAIGPRVEVDYDGQRRTGVVAYLNRRNDGEYRLGIEWIQVTST